MKPIKLNQGLVSLVKLMADGQYHDGTSLGEALQMTRSAVWKIIKKLENYHIQLDSIKGKGYSLLEPLILLDKQEILNGLNNPNIEIDIFESISSTNDYLKTFFNKPQWRVCLAERQTAGRGRLQRQWFSPFGKNIYFSLLCPFEKDVSELTGLSLIISLAVVKTCQVFLDNSEIKVKWPNDVIYQNKKLAGNLIELQAESNGHCAAIIGIGINANMLIDDSVEIDQAWTSLREIKNVYLNRNHFVSQLLNNLDHYLHRFEKEGLRGFVDEWKEVDAMYGRHITLQGVSHHIQGVSQGINEHGYLVMQLDNGSTTAYSSGDVRIQKT